MIIITIIIISWFIKVTLSAFRRFVQRVSENWQHLREKLTGHDSSHSSLLLDQSRQFTVCDNFTSNTELPVYIVVYPQSMAEL